MPQVATQSRFYPADLLRTMSSRLLQALRLDGPDAELVADSLVESNLRGIDSHGVARLTHYLNRIGHGSINPRPAMAFERLGPSVGRLGGDHALGQLVMWRATGHAIDLAREAGAGWVAVADSSHCGALSYYGLRLADAGMIGLVFTHVDPMVIPFGARQAFCGTNPICITAPHADGEHLCLDMATSVVPWNTIQNAAIENVPIPDHWAVDAQGRATTDASRVKAVLPVGGYKGSGLGLLIDVLCSMLSGSPYGPDIPRMYGDLSQRRHLGGLVGAIDIARFGDVDHVRRRITELVTRWGQLAPAQPGGAVLYPGQPERLSREQRLVRGIPLGLKVVDELNAWAVRYDVPPLDTRGPTGHPDREPSTGAPHEHHG